MGAPLRVLLVEDSEDDAVLLVRELRRAGWDVSHRRVESAADMRAALDGAAWDLVLGDYNMPSFSGTAALSILRGTDPDTPFIFVSGTIGEEVAVAAMKAGASDYVMKGNLKRLIPAIERELRDAQVRRERRQTQQSLLERTRLAEVTSEVGIALAHGADLRESLTRCARALVRHIDVAAAGVWTTDEQAEVLRLAGGAGLPEGGGGLEAVTAGSGPIGRVARSREPVGSPIDPADFETGDREWLERAGVTTFAAYPLLAGGRLAGVLAAFCGVPPTGPVLRTLGALADQLAVAIERRRAEAELRRSEERFSKVFRGSPIGIAISSMRDGRYIDANEAFLRMAGYGRAELLEHTVTDPGLWPYPGQRPGAPDPPVRDVELQLRTRDGGLVHGLASFELIQIGGEPCLLSLVHDIGERLRLEEQLRQAQKMEAVGRLAGGVAHDFNNVLTAIMGFADLLMQDLPEGDGSRDDVQEILRAAQRATTLTRQLLAFSRRQVLEPSVLIPNEVIEDAEPLLRRLVAEDVVVITSLSPDVGAVRVDPGQLEQVIVNLVANARDAMPAGGRVTIETAPAWFDDGYVGVRPGDYVMIAVSDTGTGMDAETRAHIFEPFFTTKGPGQGTGLGLATVYGIVQQSDGFIWVASEPGRGATFRIYLPRVDEPVEERAPRRPETDPAGGTETILVVEDSPAVREVSRAALERYGYSVLEAGSGTEALRLVGEHNGPIHLLFTDVVMAEIGGRELARQLLAARPGLRVLYTSGYSDEAIMRHGVLEPGIPFLQKPFSPRALARKVREVLG